MSSREVELVVIVAVTGRGGLEHGLQDKSGKLSAGDVRGDGEEYRCMATVRPGDDGAGPPGGPFAHGKSGERHLYLSYRGSDGEWMRRTKIALPQRVDPSVTALSIRVRDVGTTWVVVEEPWADVSGDA